MKKIIFSILTFSSSFALSKSLIYTKFATCPFGDTTLSIYNDNSFLGQIVSKSKNEDNLYKDAKQRYDGDNIVLDFKDMVLVINSKTGEGKIAQGAYEAPLSCKILSVPKVPSNPNPGRNCWQLPPGTDPFDIDPKICPPDDVWGIGAVGGFMCCKRPPA